MKTDLQHSSVAVANELGPLAKQKASSVIADGEQLLKHRQSSEDQQKVSGKLTMLREKIEEIVNLARQKIEGNSHLFEEVQRLAAWLRETAEPFLANNGNLGADSNSAQDFVQAHWTFSIDLIVSCWMVFIERRRTIEFHKHLARLNKHNLNEETTKLRRA